MRKVQGIVDQLKGHREILYKLGTKMTKGTLEHYLKGARTSIEATNEEEKKSTGFTIGSNDTLDAFLYLLLAV